MLVDALIMLGILILFILGLSVLLAFISVCGATGRLMARRLWPVTADEQPEPQATGPVRRR